MALLMTVFFENGFSENYFPNVDNRNFPIAIRPYVSGLKEELVLNAEVWDGQWKLRRSPQYSLILKGDPVESAEVTNNGSKERYDEKGAGQRAGSEGTCD